MPYAPGIQYRGDQYVAQGQSALLGAAGEAVSNLLTEKKQNAQKAATLRKALALYDPQNKDTYGAMGLPELEGTMQGLSVQKAMEDHKMKQAAQQQEQQLNAARVAELNRSAAADDALQRAIAAAGQQTPAAALGQGRGPVPMSPVTVTPETLLRAVASAPQAVNSRNFDNVLRAMEQGNAGADANLYKVQEGRTSTGTPYVTYGRQFNFDPSYTGEQRFAQQGQLLDKRESLRAQRQSNLSAADLLKSYQADLEALNKAWDLPADERAARRAEITAQIKAMRGPADGKTVPAKGTGPGESDIAYLKAHPELKSRFETRFGNGSAAKYLQ